MFTDHNKRLCMCVHVAAAKLSKCKLFLKAIPQMKHTHANTERLKLASQYDLASRMTPNNWTRHKVEEQNCTTRKELHYHQRK